MAKRGSDVTSLNDGGGRKIQLAVVLQSDVHGYLVLRVRQRSARRQLEEHSVANVQDGVITL